MSEFDEIKQAITNEDRSGARRALISLLRQDPDDVKAWELLATVVDDTAKQIDCYRQILRFNPGHRRAAARLEKLTEDTADTSLRSRSAEGKNPILRCPKCGGTMTVHFDGELYDKRAACDYCGTKLDLPDTFQRTQTTREKKRSLWGTTTTEKTIVEKRTDRPSESDSDIPAEIEELIDLLEGKDPEHLDDQTLKALNERGFSLSRNEQGELVIRGKPVFRRVATHIDEELTKSQDTSLSGALPLLGAFLRRFVTADAEMITEPSGRTVSQHGMVIDPEDWEDLASIKGLIETIPDTTSGPVPPEERTRCPKCTAVASVNEEKCQWCGTWFQHDGQE